MKFNFTSTEQSKHLLDIGLPRETADCYTYNYWRNGNEYHEFNIVLLNNRLWWESHNNARYTPMWSVGRLMDIALLTHPDEKVIISFVKATAGHLIEQMIMAFENHIESFDFSKLED